MASLARVSASRARGFHAVLHGSEGILGLKPQEGSGKHCAPGSRTRVSGLNPKGLQGWLGSRVECDLILAGESSSDPEPGPGSGPMTAKKSWRCGCKLQGGVGLHCSGTESSAAKQGGELSHNIGMSESEPLRSVGLEEGMHGGQCEFELATPSYEAGTKGD